MHLGSIFDLCSLRNFKLVVIYAFFSAKFVLPKFQSSQKMAFQVRQKGAENTPKKMTENN